MSVDPISAFYDRHPYPPPVEDLADGAARWHDGARRRVEHHRIWPTVPMPDDLRILVAGCGTSQAAKYAIRHPRSKVVGTDVSEASIDHTRSLARRHELDNLELHELPVEDVAELGESFDLVVCTGVLHHLVDPGAGLRALRDVLVPDGAISLMVYASYGRAGVYMIQEYCRRLGIGISPGEIDDLVATLREVPLGHPVSHVLRSTPDFRDPDALADALLNPRDRAYTVRETLALVRGADLRFSRWLRQAPYLPACGSIAETPHGERIAGLPIEDQFAAVELFRGTIARHSLIAHRHDATGPWSPTFTSSACQSYVPLRPHTAISVEERLPAGAAAALLNQAHEFPDLVMFVDESERGIFDAIDGNRTSTTSSSSTPPEADDSRRVARSHGQAGPDQHQQGTDRDPRRNAVTGRWAPLRDQDVRSTRTDHERAGDHEVAERPAHLVGELHRHQRDEQ
jgi:SAM-dependent methyltransferase